MIKREIFEKTYGEKRTDKDVAEELGYSVRWVRECRTDLLHELLPLIRRYGYGSNEKPSDIPEAPPSTSAV